MGDSAEAILAAPPLAFERVAKLGGMVGQTRVEKLRHIAHLVVEEFEGDLRSVLSLPLAKAKKALQKFPGIGEPGAEKILLSGRAHATLPLEPNGLRVMVRLGFGKESDNYAATYKSVRQAVAEQIAKMDFDWLINAHQLLRQHGQQLCKRTHPLCGGCPVASHCAYYQSNR